jgi:hypothetical protein
MTEPSIPLKRFRVTVRQYNFLTGEIVAPEGITEDNLREILFGMEERGEVDWDVDAAETHVTELSPIVTEEPAPSDPDSVDFDGGAE